MVTFRSRFSLEQFRRVLQPVAHNIAQAAVQKLNGNVAIKAFDGQLFYVVADEVSVRFYKRSISVWDYKKHVFIQVEEHPYSDGNMTKIVCQGRDAKVKERAERFIADLMKGVKPESEFSLKKFAQKKP
jgi:hypothetical protein